MTINTSNLDNEGKIIFDSFDELNDTLNLTIRRVKRGELLNQDTIDRIENLIHSNLERFFTFNDSVYQHKSNQMIDKPTVAGENDLQSNTRNKITLRGLYVSDNDLFQLVDFVRKNLLTLERVLPKDQSIELVTKMVQDEFKDSKYNNEVLFFLADPDNLPHLRLLQEMRGVKHAQRISRLRETFLINIAFSIRPQDFSAELEYNHPDFVHFSGHGSKKGNLCFENDKNQYTTVSPEIITDVLRQFNKKIKCVVLNACFSHETAKRIAEHIDYAIGMQQEISDNAAICFSVAFYQAIGNGETIPVAFELAKKQLILEKLGKESETPLLFQKKYS